VVAVANPAEPSRPPVRKIVVWMSLSLDGFIEGPNREIDWHRVDEELACHFNDELRDKGAFIDGRVTYELMARFWPAADSDPAASPATVEFARIWREMPKLVYSRTLREAGWNTTVVREVVREEVLALKAAPGGDLVLGGADLSNAFLRLGLVDEFQLYIHPAVIGSGKRLFPSPGATLDLHLVEARPFDNGVVLLRYRTPDQA